MIKLRDIFSTMSYGNQVKVLHTDRKGATQTVASGWAVNVMADRDILDQFGDTCVVGLRCDTNNLGPLIVVETMSW